MKIKKIQLKNGYKRFYNLTIDLGENPKRIIALIGPNGCGKSSVLDGMLFHHNSHGAIGNKGTKDFTYHSMNQEPNFSYQSIVIDFVEGSYVELRQKKQIDGKQNTMFSFRSPYRYNSQLKVKQTKATTEIRLNNFGASTSSDIDDKMEENYRRLKIKYDNHLNTENCRPSEAKTKIIGDLNSSLINCLDLEIINLGTIEEDKGTLYFRKSDSDNVFDFNVLSSGEKEVVDILLDLYLRQEEYEDTVFLIDEPELHINTSIQRKLLFEIDKLIGENCQIWIATHSIGLLRALQEDFKEDSQIIQFTDGVDYASTEQVLIPMNKNWKNWKEVFKTALDDLTELISPRRIIYCEGKDTPSSVSIGEERGLDAKVYNNIFSEKYHDTLFVSSGGNTELDQRSEIALLILSKVLSDIEILVLKDMDMASGKGVDSVIREEYLKLNPNNHRVLKRWEIENYLFDKEVLKRYCEVNSKEFNEKEYDELIKDITKQDVKKEFNRIKNLCNISVSISAEKFKIELSKVIIEDMKIYNELEKCIFN